MASKQNKFTIKKNADDFRNQSSASHIHQYTDKGQYTSTDWQCMNPGALEGDDLQKS